MPPPGVVYKADNLALLSEFETGSVNLIYTDPPFNTGATQRRTTLRTVAAPDGDRIGFQGRRYRSEVQGQISYNDQYDDYLAFLKPRLIEMQRLLNKAGSLYLHLDSREVHYVKVLCDTIFGRDTFLNEIIWAYDFGGRPRNRWPAKHDTILLYVKTPGAQTFNQDGIDRIPYMAPGLVGPDKAAKGKLPTDVWWHTIVPTSGAERTGYPTQKPVALAQRIIAASSNPGDLVLDPFAGSGTVGAAATTLDRRLVLIDENDDAIECMRRRLPQETEFHPSNGD